MPLPVRYPGKRRSQTVSTETPGALLSSHWLTLAPEWSLNFTCLIDPSIDPPLQVSYQPCPKPSASLPSYQPCPKPAAGLPSYQPCAPPKPPGLPGCSALMDDASSSSYSTEVKVMEESGGVIKSLSFQPEPLQTKTERADGYDYRYAYPNTYRYDDY